MQHSVPATEHHIMGIVELGVMSSNSIAVDITFEGTIGHLLLRMRFMLVTIGKKAFFTEIAARVKIHHNSNCRGWGVLSIK